MTGCLYEPFPLLAVLLTMVCHSHGAQGAYTHTESGMTHKKWACRQKLIFRDARKGKNKKVKSSFIDEKNTLNTLDSLLLKSFEKILKFFQKT